MEDQIRELLQLAIEEKRQGSFRESVNTYFKAIEIDPTNKAIYVGLGKTAYLAGDPNLSIVAYLSYAHLSIKAFKKSVLNQTVTEVELVNELFGEYESKAEALKKQLPLYASLLFSGQGYPMEQLKIHIGHTGLDFMPDRPEEYDPLVEIYRNRIQGNGTRKFPAQEVLTLESLDETFYAPYGFEMLLREIKWNYIGESDVINLYWKDNPVIRSRYRISERLLDPSRALGEVGVNQNVANQLQLKEQDDVIIYQTPLVSQDSFIASKVVIDNELPDHIISFNPGLAIPNKSEQDKWFSVLNTNLSKP